uniref:Uncharacterized protein n=1 Tax=Cacopsylla melanoneura TaxID=428564 RepID=A0A8D8LVI1_9HEMI
MCACIRTCVTYWQRVIINYRRDGFCRICSLIPRLMSSKKNRNPFSPCHPRVVWRQTIRPSPHPTQATQPTHNVATHTVRVTLTWTLTPSPCWEQAIRRRHTIWERVVAAAVVNFL